jgi:hypothetical protein
MHNALTVNQKQDLKMAYMGRNMSSYTATPAAGNSVILTEAQYMLSVIANGEEGIRRPQTSFLTATERQLHFISDGNHYVLLFIFCCYLKTWASLPSRHVKPGVFFLVP